MQKVDQNFIKRSFSPVIDHYSQAAKEIRLWESEQYLFKKYYKELDGRILDIGCGAGRTTFALAQLGYQNIIGLDLSNEMIQAAEEIEEEFNYEIEFVVGDAINLSFADSSFDYALFSFNGLMQIPEYQNRLQALKEIKRVLKSGGIFIFTTHDREGDTDYRDFWAEEEKRWERGQEDQRLYEYGDRIIEDDNLARELFLHFPNRAEVIKMIKEANLELIKDFYRSEVAEESKAVKEFSNDCRFWVVKG